MSAGGTFFFTLVTARRALVFQTPAACALLGDCLRLARHDRPFRVEAIVLLPDHLHMIWSLPDGDADFSTRIAAVKSRFTRLWLAGGANESQVAPGQGRERRRGIWQARFMEHLIRDEMDLIHHVEYIHYNPVKHGLAECPAEWPHSSFHRYVRLGDYPSDWACSQRGAAPVFGRVEESLIE